MGIKLLIVRPPRTECQEHYTQSTPQACPWPGPALGLMLKSRVIEHGLEDCKTLRGMCVLLEVQGHVWQLLAISLPHPGHHRSREEWFMIFLWPIPCFFKYMSLGFHACYYFFKKNNFFSCVLREKSGEKCLDCTYFTHLLRASVSSDVTGDSWLYTFPGLLEELIT